MKRAIYAAVVLAGAALASSASADVLHGACLGCTEVQIGGNDVTLLGPGGVTGFGFTSSPGGLTGDLQLKFLIPNTFSLTQVNNFATQVSVTGTSTGDIVVANGGAQFTSGFLETFLGHPGVSPPNPLNAFIGATQTVQPGATGYYVLTADVGNYTLGGQSDPLADIFSLNPAVFASGSLILANLFEENGDINSTAQSSALFFNGPTLARSVPCQCPDLLLAPDSQDLSRPAVPSSVSATASFPIRDRINQFSAIIPSRDKTPPPSKRGFVFLSSPSAAASAF